MSNKGRKHLQELAARLETVTEEISRIKDALHGLRAEADDVLDFAEMHTEERRATKHTLRSLEEATDLLENFDGESAKYHVLQAAGEQ